jgi:hypothetical protein
MLLAVGLASTSISLDFTSLIDMAFQIINSLWPLFIVPMGLMFGLALIGWIISEVKKSIPHG